MHATFRTRGRRAQAVVLGATGLMTFALLGSPGPAQESEQPGRPLPTTEPRQARQGAGQADQDLSGRLMRLHEEFGDRFREAVRGAQDPRFSNASTQDMIVTMLGTQRVIAGFPVHGESGMRSLPAEPGGRTGETRAGRGAGQDGGQDEGQDAGPGGRQGESDDDARTGARTLPGSTPEGHEVLGIIVIGGTMSGEASPIPAGAPRRAGEDPNAGAQSTAGITGRSIRPGTYEVHWMGGDLIALVDESGSPVLGTSVTDGQMPDAGPGRLEERKPGAPRSGGATERGGAGKNGGATERGGAGQTGGATERGGVAGAGQRDGAGGAADERLGERARAQALSERPAWSRVYLAIVREVAATSITGR